MPTPGYDAPSAPLMTWYNKKNLLGSSSTAPVEAASYREQMALSQISVLNKGDEPTIKVLRDNGYRRQILQYILFTEVSYWSTDSGGTFTSTSPRSNNWCLSSIPWRTAIEYEPTAWLHLASSTVSASASAGATTVSVPDLTKFQNVGGGARGIVDVWSSIGTYLGCFHYTGVSATSGSGTLTVPASGYGSIGYDPTTLSGVGATNPQTGAAWSLTTLANIPSGAVLRARVRSGAVSQSSNTPSTGNHFFIADPTSNTFRFWIRDSYDAYIASSPGGSAPTDEWDGIFLDNLHTDAEKFKGISSGTYGNTPGFAMPTTIAGATWSQADWDTGHADLIAWIHDNFTTYGLPMWGNAYPQEWGSTAPEIAERDAYLAQCVAYEEAGIDGVMLEDFPTAFTSSAIDYLSQAEFDNGLAFVDGLLAAGLKVLCVTQGAATNGWTDASAGAFAAAVALLLQEDGRVYMRHTNYASGTYPQWWPVDAYHYRLGRPTGPRTKTGTSPAVYARPYERGSVSISYPTSGAPTVTITRNASQR